ncbi:hypothetical protein ARMA_1730 [Ardenticatena maritima]|uniref:Uncharacterized protein n=1 Tax=Ardenticatena maritima TaxID=872965 RepID=A0A0M9UCX1_9CHLR|nr:hypothetical protein ARMA_1730 [Ardenticatena maritima]
MAVLTVCCTIKIDTRKPRSLQLAYIRRLPGAFGAPLALPIMPLQPICMRIFSS